MGIAVARTDELPPGRSRKFQLDCAGQRIEGFVLNVGGVFHAWVNRCRHVSIPLDWVENQFLTEDGQFIQCATHGAFYLPDSGECIAGPPCGKALFRIPITISDGVILAECPGALPD